MDGATALLVDEKKGLHVESGDVHKFVIFPVCRKNDKFMYFFSI